MIDIHFRIIGDGKIPVRSHPWDAGYDCFIRAFRTPEGEDIDENEFHLEPYRRILCLLGFATRIPHGYYAQVVPRSGLALKHGLTIVNSPGTVDPDYRGEWGAIVLNTSNVPYTLRKGDRICQMIVREMVQFRPLIVEDLDNTERGDGGYGSTGR